MFGHVLKLCNSYSDDNIHLTILTLSQLSANLLSVIQTVLRGEWASGLYSLRQVTEVKLGRVRSDFGWVTSKD